MGLFQKSVQDKYLSELDEELVAKAYKRYSGKFLNLKRQQEILAMKEEEYQDGFLDDLFCYTLGYIKKPNKGWNLEREKKNEGNSKKADGAILNNGIVKSVIELKSTKTKNLDDITKQASEYKLNHTDCTYIITSNFEKLRFYIDDLTKEETFNLFTLTYDEFKLLYLCLASENIIADLPKKIKGESLTEEKRITKQLYNDYSVFKRALYSDLVKRNSRNEKFREHVDKQVRHTLFKSSQKLLDRFLFIFFAEDKSLLPINLIAKINKEWKEAQSAKFKHSLYEFYKAYFNDLNVGNKEEGIFQYNGGLFKADSILDNVEIDDELLYKHTTKLSEYNFSSEVDVNILGHIFENSLNDIESINADIESGVFDEQTSRRKKDGVFYTPQYITKYIVEDTVGKLCKQKKVELDINEENYKTGKKRSKQRIDRLEEYRLWLLELTILDPACGSGAFLNQALEFLIAEHKWLNELASKYHGTPMGMQNADAHILEKNIYGVDINEESVEIAKLSLWLRTAQKGRKLTTLSKHIKCGNSLIDKNSIAGGKAFNWVEKFPEVFAKGGFDVIIGNPPYLRVQGLRENFIKESEYFEKSFDSATGRFDIYVLFMEKSMSLIKEHGLISMILPHKFLVSDFGEGIRKYFANNKFVNSIVHFGSEMVFEDASTYTCIIGLSKNNKQILYKQLHPNKVFELWDFDIVAYDNLSGENWNLKGKGVESVFTTLNKNRLKIKDVFSNVSRGVVTGADSIFILEGKYVGDLFKGFSKALDCEINIEAELVKPILMGNSLSRFSNLENDLFLIYPHCWDDKTKPYEEDVLEKEFPKAYEYLCKFKEQLQAKKIKYKTNPKYWYSLHNSRELLLFESIKIITPYLANRSQMALDKSGGFYMNDKCSFLKLNENYSKIPYEYLLGILNSNLLWFFIKYTSSEYSGGYFAFTNTYLEPFPLPNLDDIQNQYELVTLVRKISELTDSSNSEIKKIQDYILDSYKGILLTKKLQNWHNLEYAEYVIELNKALKKAGKDKLTKDDEIEFGASFKRRKELVETIKSEISKTDAAIDKMVYELYGLTDEEIAIVESSN